MAEPVHALRVVGRSGVMAWQRLPVSRIPAGLRRRTRQQLAARRETFIHSVVAPLSQGSAGFVVYAMVLGGHTLNLHLTLPPGTDQAATVELLAGDGEQTLATPAHMRPAGPPVDGRASVGVTALLGPAVGGLALTPGRWSVSLRITPADGAGKAQTIRLIGQGQPPALAGATKPFGSCPVSGERFRTGMSPTGRLRLIASAAPQHTEIARVSRLFAGLEMDFLPPRGAGDGRLEATDGHQVVDIPYDRLPGNEGLLHCVLPLHALLAADERRAWGFRWTTPDGRQFWLRRRADDLGHARAAAAAGSRLAIAAPTGALSYVNQRHTVRGTYQVFFASVPGPATPVRAVSPSSTSTATPGPLA